MNWISKLLRKSPVPPAPPPAPTRLENQPLVDDSGKLRRDLIGAANDEERQRIALDLGRTLAGLAQTPQPDDPSGVWVAAICQVADKALALAWTARLEGGASLGEVTIHGRFSEVRLAALQRVEDKAMLERIAHAIRDKDKRVHRCCAERLRQIRKANEDVCRAEEVTAALRDLLDVAPVPLSRLLDLKKEFHALGEDAQANSPCQALLDQAHARLQQEASEQRDLRVREADAQRLFKECAEVECPQETQLHHWRDRLNALAQAQAGLPPWLCGQAQALEVLLHDIDSRLTALDAESEATQACEAFLDRIATDTPDDEASAAAAWAALIKPGNPELRQAFESRWRALHAPAAHVPVPTKPAPPPVAAELDHDAVRRLLEKLEQDVAQGHLAAADATAKSLGAVMSGNRLSDALESRLQSANARLGELRGWARWSTQQVREELIAAAEQLLAGTPSVDDLAQGVQELREKWKQLNAHGETAKGQWERFDAALKKAYEPVAAYRAEEAARHAVAREAKEALCAEWESHISAIVWEQADYKAIETIRQEFLRRWREVAPAGFRDERVLRKRFDNLLGSVDQRLETVRAVEIERLEQLVAEAEALRESPDLGRAITTIKALQGRWSGQASPLQPNRRDGQKLWKRFRAACDAVFARRDAQRAQQTEQQTAQREESAQAAQALLDAFVKSLAGDDANSIKRALNQFQADWKVVKTNSRELAAGLEARARELQQQAQQRIETLHHDRHIVRFELLATKAALAEGVEAAVVAQQDARIEETKKAWDALPRLPVESENLLAARWARAPGVTAKDLASGRDVREVILLDMEIALGLPSPESSADARRRRQLEHLQTRFGAEAAGQSKVETLLVRWYATAAAPDATLDQRMASVKRRLLEQDGESGR